MPDGTWMQSRQDSRRRPMPLGRGLGARWATEHLSDGRVAGGPWALGEGGGGRAEQNELHGASQLVLESKTPPSSRRAGQGGRAAASEHGIQQRASSFSLELTSPVPTEFALWSGIPGRPRIATAAGLAAGRSGTSASLGQVLALGIEAEADLAAGGAPMELDVAKESQSIALALLDRMRALQQECALPAALLSRHWRKRCWPYVRRSLAATWRPPTGSLGNGRRGWAALGPAHNQSYAGAIREAEATLAQRRDRPRAAHGS